MHLFIRRCAWLLVVVLGVSLSTSSGAVVRGTVSVSGPDGKPQTRDIDIVVWLSPASGAPAASAGRRSNANPQIVQRNKRFLTRVLAVEAGTVVDFPNHDPFFHNVFSLFEGTRFDLGLYEAGSNRSIRFDKPGVSYIFCNIHSQMTAAVVVVDSPYFVMLKQPGAFEIPQVPAGRYQLKVWADQVAPEALRELIKLVTVTEQATVVGTIQVRRSKTATAHPNKYGKDYDPEVFSGPIYSRP